MELLQSPWLIELGAFCLNFKGSEDGDYPSGFSTHFFFNVDVAPTMTLMLPDSIKLEYDLTCPICLVNFLLLAVIQRDESIRSLFDNTLNCDDVAGNII